jgi:hypothetical protein
LLQGRWLASWVILLCSVFAIQALAGISQGPWEWASLLAPWIGLPFNFLHALGKSHSPAHGLIIELVSSAQHPKLANPAWLHPRSAHTGCVCPCTELQSQPVFCGSPGPSPTCLGIPKKAQ